MSLDSGEKSALPAYALLWPSPPDMPRSRWCFSSSAQLNYLNTL